MNPSGTEHRHDHARGDDCCGNGLHVVFPVLLGLVFFGLAVAAGFALFRGEPAAAPLPAPEIAGAIGWVPVLGVAAGLFALLMLLGLLALLFCCCRKGGLPGLGLLAPLACPVIEGLRAAADALDGAAAAIRGVDEVIGLSGALGETGQRLKAAAAKVGELKVPDVSAPGTGDLFQFAVPLPELGHLRPSSRVLLGDLSVTPDAQALPVSQARDGLHQAGEFLATAGQRLAALADQLQAAATAFRGIAGMLAFIVPCDEWARTRGSTSPWMPGIPAKGGHG